jgi:hypothetical protein
VKHDIANARYQIALAREDEAQAVHMADRLVGDVDVSWRYGAHVGAIVSRALSAKHSRVLAVMHLLSWGLS